MRRTLIAVVVAVAALSLLAACGGQKVADPPVASSTPAAASSSASPTPPVMPALAKEHTKAGAKAFVVYLWKVIDYATLNSDPAPLARLFATGCTGCGAGLDGIRKRSSAHAKIVGGEETLSNLSVNLAEAGGQPQAEASMTITNTDQIVSYPSPTAAATFPANSVPGHVILRQRHNGWYVTELAVG